MNNNEIKLSIVDCSGAVKKETRGEDFIYLEYLEEYDAGDRIVTELAKSGQYLMVSLDEALAPTLLYIKNKTWQYEVPVDENLRRAYSPKAFSGRKHYMYIRTPDKEEVERYQNIAFNPHDQKPESGAFPHAEANVVTREESTFEARNAIDGVVANTYHGNYPYESWGINRQKDAMITILFGRMIEVDQVQLVLRGDYPHDSYWTKGILEFSDGSREELKLEKALGHQRFMFEPRRVEWARLKELQKADDESPFPALTQIEIYGKNIQ